MSHPVLSCEKADVADRPEGFQRNPSNFQRM